MANCHCGHCLVIVMIEIIEEVKAPKGLKPLLRRVLGHFIKLHRVKSDICLVLTSDEHIQSLKKQHWGEDAVTDVLTFPQWEPGDRFMPPHLGDIMIALPTAERQAAEHGHSHQEEVVFLALHGFIHLLGHDHQTEADWQPFREAEAAAKALLAGLLP
jgi:probable rRNA maturation factor